MQDPFKYADLGRHQHYPSRAGKMSLEDLSVLSSAQNLF